MILYFSGTGNSEYAAKHLGQILDEEVLDIFEKLRGHDHSQLQSNDPWVIVTPTYAWRLPRLVQEWLEQTPLTGSREIYFVLTCGGSIGNAVKYLRKFCAAKRLDYRGCAEVIMPENYIALYSAPPQEEALALIKQAEGVLEAAALVIKSRGIFPKPTLTLKDRVRSSIENAAFYPALVHAKKFYATEACVSCGQCVSLCPLHNIHLANGRPVWGKHCTHCMACICRWPQAAIEYGDHTKGLRRYVCPEHL